MPNRYPEPASHLRKLQANPANKHPGPASRLCKLQANPVPTDTLNLRHSPANQAPARPRKSYRPAKGGGWAPHARVCVHLHGHAHTFTGMRTAMVFGHASDETSGRSPQTPNQSSPNKRPEPATGLPRSMHPTDSRGFQRPTTGGHGRRCGVAATSTTGGAAPACLYDRA